MDNWNLMLRDLEPEYDKISQVIDMGPEILPVLINNKKRCILLIQETYPDFINLVDKEILEEITSSHLNLDNTINQVSEELKTWKGCRRIAWDRWEFDSRKNAEKFVTLFHLKWQK